MDSTQFQIATLKLDRDALSRLLAQPDSKRTTQMPLSPEALSRLQAIQSQIQVLEAQWREKQTRNRAAEERRSLHNSIMREEQARRQSNEAARFVQNVFIQQVVQQQIAQRMAQPGQKSNFRVNTQGFGPNGWHSSVTHVHTTQNRGRVH